MSKQEIDDERLRELLKAEQVATGVWKWLQAQQTIQLVPWTNNSDEIECQAQRNDFLKELETVILNLS